MVAPMQNTELEIQTLKLYGTVQSNVYQPFLLQGPLPLQINTARSPILFYLQKSLYFSVINFTK